MAMDNIEKNKIMKFSENGGMVIGSGIGMGRGYTVLKGDNFELLKLDKSPIKEEFK